MYYRGYLSPIPCPRCGTLNNQIREECRFCNGPLVNRCSDEDCDTDTAPNARYCKRCGKPTLFLIYKVFDEEFCARKREEAAFYYWLYGDPDSPEAKAEEARRRRNYREQMRRDNPFDPYDDDDFPEPPLDPDEIPYY